MKSFNNQITGAFLGGQRFTWSVLRAVMGGVLAAAGVSAETPLFAENFESYPTLNPISGADASFDAVWASNLIPGPNTSWVYAAGGGGSGFQSKGWITNVDNSTITATVSLADLAGSDADDGGGNILPGAVFRLSFVAGVDTSLASRTLMGLFNVVPSAGNTGTVSFSNGTNGDGSQILTGFSDSVSVTGGSSGKSSSRSFTIEFSTTGMMTSDSLDLTFGRISGSGSWFYIVDDIELLVNPSDVLAPAVAADPATVWSVYSATIGGEVTDNGNENPNVKIYWGLTNEGTDPLEWDSEIDLGIQGGTFSRTLTALAPETEYFFKVFAENSAGGAWSTLTESFTTSGYQGITATLASGDFTWKYEMDDNPTGQDLDAAGSATDWFAGTAGGVKAPQNYTGGIGVSNHSPGSNPLLRSVTIARSGDDVTLDWTLSEDGAVDLYGTDNLVDGFPASPFMTVESGTTAFTDVGGGTEFPARYFYKLDPVVTSPTPEVLFRTDFGGSIQRENLIGTGFTVEIAARMLGPKDAGDVGILGIALDPGGAASAFRLNVDTTEVSQNEGGTDLLGTSGNTDAMHVFRIAYSFNDERYWVWRDDVLIYGGDLMTGVVGTNGGFDDLGSFFIGDFSQESLSGEWEVDYIRLHDEALAPVAPL